MKTFTDLINECLDDVHELFPWDLAEEIEAGNHPLIVDIREPYEFDAMHIENSVNVPRGILESACEWDYEETVPELVNARDEDVVLVCRSGNRSVLAAHTMEQLGYMCVRSLKTGLRGWNDDEQKLVDNVGNQLDFETADEYFKPKIRPDQLKPK
jgi:rhodanese-related sulfurtransferase